MNLMKLKLIYKDLGVDYKESPQESTGIVIITIVSRSFPLGTAYFFNKEGDFIEQCNNYSIG